MVDGYSTRVRVFMWAVTALSVPLLVVTGDRPSPRSRAVHRPRSASSSRCSRVVLIAGEMWPIPVSRGEESSDEITVSSTFGLALLLVAPRVLHDPRAGRGTGHRLAGPWRAWSSLPFNVAQYAFAFTGARAIYAWSRRSRSSPPASRRRTCWRRSSPAPPSSSSTTAWSGMAVVAAARGPRLGCAGRRPDLAAHDLRAAARARAARRAGSAVDAAVDRPAAHPDRRAAPQRRHRHEARAGGAARPAHRPGQPHAARQRCGPRAASTAARRRCCSSTSTTSRTSTTPSATPSATSCCSPWPLACGSRSARTTSSPASAGTSSSSWPGAATAPTRPSRWRAGSARRSASPTRCRASC